MLVRDGVIKKIFAEPDVAGDPYGVSDADTMLAYIAPQATAPMDVSMLTRKDCPYCVKAKGLLRDANIEFEELVLNKDYTDRSLRAISGTETVPQIFVNGEHIGNSEALEVWLGKRVAA